MKKLFLILIAVAGVAILAILAVPPEHVIQNPNADAHAANGGGLMVFDVSNIDGETCKSTQKEIADKLLFYETLKPPPSPESQEYRVKDWEARNYVWRNSWAAAFFIYHKCYYDWEATEIRILDMDSGRPVARFTEKKGYETLK